MPIPTQIDLGTQAKANSLTAAQVANATLTNTQIAAAAAIAFSKLASLSTGQFLVGSGGTVVAATMGGDATVSAVGAITIANSAITDVKIASGTISDGKLATAYIKADGTRAFTGAQAMGGFKITNLGAPSAATDAATRGYVDSVAQGLSIKGSCDYLADSDQTLTGPATIDGFAVVPGDRILCVNQALPVQNGIYVVDTGGPWLRSADMAAGTHADGAFAFIEHGNSYKSTGWVCNTQGPNDVVGTNPIVFTQFIGAGTTTAGTGLTQLGNVISLDIPVSIAHGGTGATTAPLALAALGGVGGTGTAGYLAKFSGTSAIANSLVSEAGSVVTVTGTLNVTTSIEIGGVALALSNLSDGATALRTNASKTLLSGNTITVASGAAIDFIGDLKIASATVTATATELNDVGLFIVREVPSGSINGANQNFSLNHVPIAASESVFLNGLLQDDGGNDYSIVADAISFTVAPPSGSKLVVSYRYHSV
jgi:hypothetical protein